MADEVLSQFTQAKQEVQKTVTRNLRIGIIGTGWIAESHIQSYLKQPDVEIVAAADLIPGKARAFLEKWAPALADSVRYYPDHHALLEAEPDLDAVSVCTYNRTHAVCTIDALNHGVSVLLEKPMCVTTDEAVAICRAEKQSGKVLSIGFQPRFDENMKMIKRIVESGALGEVYYIQTGGGRRRGIPNSTFIEQSTAGIGALGDIGCYSLDMVLNAVGYPKPLTVSGYISDFFGKNPKYNNPADAARFNVDDFAAAFVRLEGGIILDFRIAWAMHADSPGDTILFGKEGALRIPATDCWNGSVGGAMTLYHDVAGERTETTIPILKNNPAKGGLFDQKIRSFLDAVLAGAVAPVPSSQILYNQAIIDGILQSAQAGREIEISIPEI
ncbi:MAG: Gfo/Idh/MocA family oxidoreductase [Oscillospiraceae bacterium]|jgi:predicted dehydrogenase|nr:Gfo/Idh/MocA family oxidoreductase [Oscillospiraceae bacterium]